MKLRTFMVIQAVAAGGFGLCFTLLPGLMLNLYGIGADPGAILMATFFGKELVGDGILCWLASKTADSNTGRSIILALLISRLLGLYFSLTGTLNGVMGPFGWSAVVIYFILVLGWGYFAFRPRSSSVRTNTA